MPARVKCALLAWHTLEDMLNKNDENGKGTINCCHQLLKRKMKWKIKKYYQE